MKNAEEVREFVGRMAVWHPKGYSGTDLRGEWVVLDPQGGKDYHSRSKEVIVVMICADQGIKITWNRKLVRNLVISLVLGVAAAAISGWMLLVVFGLPLVFLAAAGVVAGAIGGIMGHMDTRGGRG